MQHRYVQVMQVKDLLSKGCGNRFHHELLSLNVRDKDSRSKWLPHLLIGKLFNHLHLHVAMLHLSMW